MPHTLRRSLTACAAVALLPLAACGDDTGASSASGLTVVAGFYPLEYVVTRVAGEHVDVVTLTQPGVDPHDLDLSPRDVGVVGSADLVVYSSGMQAAVDAAVEQQDPDHVVDAAVAANLVGVDEHDHSHDHNEDDHNEDDHASHDHVDADPHFWLDPERYADVVEAVTDELAEIDPDRADTYRANADALLDDLATLDQAYADGLQSCEYTEVVTTHAAFGYLTDRYGLTQVSMTGISPDTDPSPGRMAEIASQVDDLGVPTIYSEVIAGTEVADTIAAETGVEVVQLDPLEGLSDDSPGSDYLEVMEANLNALRTGQVCS